MSLEEIRNARLHTIYIIDVDETTVEETDPSAYTEKRPVGVTVVQLQKINTSRNKMPNQIYHLFLTKFYKRNTRNIYSLVKH